ncbi:MAG: nucleotidyltransferase [Planctomycetota bacterium]|nr:nucleotidyltransferase [Planctomycetota bacterium]
MDLSHTRGLDRDTAEFYVRALDTLERSGVPFLLGGAYALTQYTGIARHTKDLDVFMRREDVEVALAVLEASGLETERSFPHWLAKARWGDRYVDLIYASGNGVAVVDDEWFIHAVEGVSFGRSVRVIPPEEMIWSKAWVQERERYDGADVMHLLRATAPRLDWERLLRRFGDRWRVLFSYVVLFGFVYPGLRHHVPDWITQGLLARFQAEQALPERNGDEGLCRGTLLSREQYCVDVREWGHEDARLRPDCAMTADDIRIWTDAIGGERKAS